MKLHEKFKDAWAMTVSLGMHVYEEYVLYAYVEYIIYVSVESQVHVPEALLDTYI